MTNSNDRLARLENRVESSARAIDDLLRVSDQYQQNFEVLAYENRRMRAEITGLQTENRRMLNKIVEFEQRLEAQRLEFEQQIKSQLGKYKQEARLAARLAASEVQMEITRQAVLMAGLG